MIDLKVGDRVILIRKIGFVNETELGNIPINTPGIVTEILVSTYGNSQIVRVLFDGYLPPSGFPLGWGIYGRYVSKIYSDPVDEIMDRIYGEKQ